MVRIVSGQSQDDPNAAMLSGMQMGRMYREAQQDRLALEQQQMGRQIQMQELALRMAKFKASRDDMLQRKAGEGSLAALQEMALRAKQKPSDEYLEMGESLLRNTRDPKIRARMYPILKELHASQVEFENQEALNTSLQDLLKSGVLDEAGMLDFEKRRAAGATTAALAKEAQDLKTKHANDAAIMDENMKALQGLPELIDAANPSPDTEKARSLLKEYELSPSEQTKKGQGAMVRQNVEAALIAGKTKQAQDYQRKRDQRTLLVAQIARLQAEGKDEEAEALKRSKLAFGVFGDPETDIPGNVFRFSEPKDPGLMRGMHQHVAGQRAEKERRYPGSTRPRAGKTAAAAAPAAGANLSQAKSPAELTEALKAAGLPKTQSSVQAILEQWRGAR